MKNMQRKLGTGVLLALALTACQSGPTPSPQTDATGPYAGGAQYPWTDRQDTVPAGTNPYAGGRQFPWKSPVAAGATTAAGTSGTVNSGTVTSQAIAGGTNYLSDLTWTSASSGWGPIEKDMSNGDQAAGDGHTLTIGGQTYSKGLGMHAAGGLTYTLSQACTTFTAQVGIDDEVGNRGTVVFQVFADGVQVYDSGVVTGADVAKAVNVNVTGVNELRLVVTTAGDNNYYDHADWADAKLSCSAPATTARYLSDATWNQATNGWGPIEKDMSNGEQAAGDGRTITIAGQTFSKGLGMHASTNPSNYYGSMVGYTLDGSSCTRFSAKVGVDDEVSAFGVGSVVFQVYTIVNGTKQKVYDSGVVLSKEAARNVNVDITGATALELVVNNAGDNNYFDHADWADAQLLCGISTTPPQTSGQFSVQNLSAGPLPDRMVFSKVGYGNPTTPSTTEHTVSRIRVTNTGIGPLEADLNVSGPFQVIEPATPHISLGSTGAYADVAVRYLGEGQRLDQGQLQITPTNSTLASKSITLAGVWQSQYENNMEPSVLDIIQTFGFKTSLPSASVLNQQGRIIPQGDERIAPYWQRADTSQPVTVSVLAAYHNQGNSSTLYWHAKGSSSVASVITSQGSDSQSILPRMNGTNVLAQTTFTPSSTFGLRVDSSEWSDPASNDQTTDISHGCVAPCGQHLRFFTAKDAAGAVIPNTYILIMDYSGVNYDYNDNMYLLSNVKPAPLLVDTGLSAGATTTDPSNGNIWVSDRDRNGFAYFTPDTAINEPSTASTATISNTAFQQLYRSYRGNVGSLTPRTISYRYPLENGTYTVNLHFAELNWSTTGKRLFDVKVNGQLAVSNLDIVAAAGGMNRALIVPVTANVTGGQLQLDLSANLDYPAISGIEVTR